MEKQIILSVTVLIAFLFCSYGCNTSEKDICRECTAIYNGSVIITRESCNEQDEQDFRNQYYYAVVKCE